MKTSRIKIAEIIDEQRKPSREVVSKLYWLIPDDFVELLKSYGEGLDHRVTPVYDINRRAVVNCDIVEDRETYYKPYLERGFNLEKMSSLEVVEDVVFPEPTSSTVEGPKPVEPPPPKEREVDGVRPADTLGAEKK